MVTVSKQPLLTSQEAKVRFVWLRVSRAVLSALGLLDLLCKRRNHKEELHRCLHRPFLV